MAPTARQSSFLAACLVILLAAAVITALIVYPAEGFLRVWAVVGTLVGILVGTLPGYLFAVTAGRADEARAGAEEKLQALLAVCGAETLREAAQLRSDLFGQFAPPPPTPIADPPRREPGEGEDEQRPDLD